MCLSRREQFARLLLIWTAIATVALVLVGCIRVVDGRARMAEPKLDSRCSGRRAAAPIRP
ncbi:putative hydrolase domain protein [Mycobacterium kansasii]|uniref:Putative hydrolase domain protein n=1 Tax=Mycobacterium kansasii TaxID=1768 RepID=A0A1V3WXP9_MYCKA|nr:putative hydrolase domain protein [Mycobacterium kansasii]